MSPLCKKSTPIQILSACTPTHSASGSHEDSRNNSWRSAHPGTRSHPDLGRHRVGFSSPQLATSPGRCSNITAATPRLSSASMLPKWSPWQPWTPTSWPRTRKCHMYRVTLRRRVGGARHASARGTSAGCMLLRCWVGLPLSTHRLACLAEGSSCCSCKEPLRCGPSFLQTLVSIIRVV